MKCLKAHKHKWSTNPKDPHSLYKICAYCNNKKLFEKDIDVWDEYYRNTRKPIGHFSKILRTVLSDNLKLTEEGSK